MSSHDSGQQRILPFLEGLNRDVVRDCRKLLQELAERMSAFKVLRGSHLLL
jgi:hypothetical protein